MPVARHTTRWCHLGMSADEKKKKLEPFWIDENQQY